MSQPDFPAAKDYAIERITRDLSADLRYHSLNHTCCEVVPAVERIAALEGVLGEELLLLRTAAYFHDIGFISAYADHEHQGIALTRAILPRFGYCPAQIQTVAAMILATRLPQQPHTLCECILADADLAVLGQPHFLTRNADLRAEQATLGKKINDAAWYCSQVAFLRSHHYWTSSARMLHDQQKLRNIATLVALLAACQRNS